MSKLSVPKILAAESEKQKKHQSAKFGSPFAN
jgi:hypothetical protein